MKKVNYIWKTFSDLTRDELYEMIHLRQKVFIVEQDCPYLDADFSDQDAFHLLGYDDGGLISYLRAFPPGIKYEGASLGRIVVDDSKRGEQLGQNLTKEGISYLSKHYPDTEIIISAQHRLENFYCELGFTARGEVYLEDDIDHIQMYFIPTQ
ncbi:MAG: GNAT family N-acetyltransferase [SAR86 cluster bacterium]|nr:GNAT family N-acetyltransferase [SAR86 cluster bacterium]